MKHHWKNSIKVKKVNVQNKKKQQRNINFKQHLKGKSLSEDSEWVLQLQNKTVKIPLTCWKKENSFIQAISIAPLQVHFYSEGLPTQHGYCAEVSRRSARGNCEWRTCPIDLALSAHRKTAQSFSSANYALLTSLSNVNSKRTSSIRTRLQRIQNSLARVVLGVPLRTCFSVLLHQFALASSWTQKKHLNW